MNESNRTIRVEYLTIEYPDLERSLVTPCMVSVVYNPDEYEEHPEMSEYMGLWDTGATVSGVSQRVVSERGLSPVSFGKVDTANGTVDNVPLYLVNIVLPERVGFAGLLVTSIGDLRNGVDVLLGMDIIGVGDFAVTNSTNTTVSYRIPSVGGIDFSQPIGIADEPKRTEQRRRGFMTPNPIGFRLPHQD